MSMALGICITVQANVNNYNGKDGRVLLPSAGGSIDSSICVCCLVVYECGVKDLGAVGPA